LAEDKINRTIVVALDNSYSMVEFYQTSLEEAKAAGAVACRQCYEELLQDAERAVVRLKGLIKGHVERGRW
jgi:methylphosphotriester-DNA--protein-cysteine methyltransferase